MRAHHASDPAIRESLPAHRSTASDGPSGAFGAVDLWTAIKRRAALGGPSERRKPLQLRAARVGLEPTTYRLRIWCSVQLSYRAACCKWDCCNVANVLQAPQPERNLASRIWCVPTGHELSGGPGSDPRPFLHGVRGGPRGLCARRCAGKFTLPRGRASARPSSGSPHAGAKGCLPQLERPVPDVPLRAQQLRRPALLRRRARVHAHPVGPRDHGQGFAHALTLASASASDEAVQNACVEGKHPRKANKSLIRENVREADKTAAV